MGKNISVSIIVPAYNAEKVIEDCLKSILKQSLQDIEVIVVEDGSKDSTREVLRRFQERDSRIRLIEKDKNEGLSAARNSGIKTARGKYIGFVDADDWVEKDYFASMYDGGRDADLIVTGYRHDAMDEAREKVNISREVRLPKGYWTDKKQVITMAAYIDTGKMFAYTWNKLYKREIIEQNQLKFSKQVLIEDFIFNTIYWDKIESLCVTGDCGYHYIKASKEALTQKFLPDFADIMNKRFDHMKRLMIANKCYCGIVKEQLANVYIKHAIAGVARNCSPEGNYGFLEQYIRAKKLLKDRHSKEACKNAKGRSYQEKICNLVFKSKFSLAVLIFGKIIYAMQTKSTAYDKLK